MGLLEITSLVSNTLLVFIGIYIAFVVARVYSLYRTLGFSRTVITPFLLVGAGFALLGITELLEISAGELGSVLHSWTSLGTSVFLLYGLRTYHKMLMKAEESKKLLKQTPER